MHWLDLCAKKAGLRGNGECVSPPNQLPWRLVWCKPTAGGSLVWCTPAAGVNNSAFVSVLNAVQDPAPCKAFSHLLWKLWPSALNLSHNKPPEQQKPFLEKQWQALFAKKPRRGGYTTLSLQGKISRLSPTEKVMYSSYMAFHWEHWPLVSPSSSQGLLVVGVWSRCPCSGYPGAFGVFIGNMEISAPALPSHLLRQCGFTCLHALQSWIFT